MLGKLLEHLIQLFGHIKTSKKQLITEMIQFLLLEQLRLIFCLKIQKIIENVNTMLVFIIFFLKDLRPVSEITGSIEVKVADVDLVHANKKSDFEGN